MIQNRERETIIVYSKEIFKQNEQKMIKEENLKRVPPLGVGWGGGLSHRERKYISLFLEYLTQFKELNINGRNPTPSLHNLKVKRVCLIKTLGHKRITKKCLTDLFNIFNIIRLFSDPGQPMKGTTCFSRKF